MRAILTTLTNAALTRSALLRDRRGATAIEYGLIAAGIRPDRRRHLHRHRHSGRHGGRQPGKHVQYCFRQLVKHREQGAAGGESLNRGAAPSLRL